MHPCRKTAIAALLFTLPACSFALERTELAPPSAQSYVRISNTAGFLAKIKQSPIGKLWADPQFKDFMGNPEADVWQEFLFDGETDAEDEMMLAQFKMLNGELVLAFDPATEDPYIIAAMSKEDFARSLELDAQLKEIAGTPFEIVKGSFQDVAVIQHIQNPGTPEAESSWQAHVGNTFILGHTQEWVEQSIVRLGKDAVKEPKGNPVLDLNLPLAQLIQQTLEKEKTAPEQMAVLEALGFMAIDSLTCRVELKDDEMVADNTLKVTDLQKGIFTILDVQPSELPTVSFIPESIASIEVGRFNLLRFWQEIPNAIASAMPAAKPQFDMILAMLQAQTGINFEQDLLANLGTQYLSFSVVDGGKQISVVAVDLKDGMAFKKGLESAMAAPALQPQVAASLDIQEFLDHKIYAFKGADAENPSGFAVAGNYLLYGHPDGLRQVIRSESSGAAANQAFERTALVAGLRAIVPPQAFAFSAIDWKKNMDAVVRELSKPQYASLITQKWATSGSVLPPPDFNKLPPASHIASFFNVSYQYTEAMPGGLHQKIILKY